MKINELYIDPTDVFDPAVLSKDTEADSPNADSARKERREKIVSAKPNSNIRKAKRIANMAKVKARDATPKDQDDTDSTYALGGHVSTWLNR